MTICIFLDEVDENTESLICNAAPENVQVIFWSRLTENERDEYIQKADALLTATYIVDRELMERGRNVKIVQKTGVGTDNIDKAAAKSLGIKVDNVPGGNANSVAELTIGLILAVYRNIIPLARMSSEKEWGMWKYREASFEIRGKTHGIIGFGHIGKRVAQLSGAFGAKVIYYNRTRQQENTEREYKTEYRPFEALLKEADIVSVHLPLVPQTKNLIGREQLKLMKSSAVIINVGRGGVINEQALYQEMKKGRFLGAGIDVWEKEPFEPSNGLLGLSNVIAMPHVGAGTLDSMRNVYRSCFERITAACGCVK